METPGNISEEMIDKISEFIYKLKNDADPQKDDDINQYAMQSLDLIFLVDDMLPTWPHSKEYLNSINEDFKECILDRICTGLEQLGIPKTTFRDDQIWNFFALYNNRGDMISSLETEIESNRRLIEAQSNILVEIANLEDDFTDIDQLRILASSVVNPDKIKKLKILTKDGVVSR